MDALFLTPGGRVRLVERIERVRRAYKAVCDDNPAALESGDTSGWHDNFAFEENHRQLHQLARRVRDLEAMLARCSVLPPLRDPPKRVVLGARVVWRQDDLDLRTAWISGFEDGDPSAGRISYDSPLAKQILGARVGEVRTVELAGRTLDIEIVDLGPTPEDR